MANFLKSTQLREKMMLQWVRHCGTQIDLFPQNVEIVQDNGFWIVNVYNEIDPQCEIHETVNTGVSKYKEIAYLKALSEHFERQAFINGRKNKLPSCQTPRSDGIAAFPYMLNKKKAAQLARSAALNEASERYIWANWWDQSIKSHISEASSSCNHLLKKCFSLPSVKNILLVKPIVKTIYEDISILIAFFEGGGVTTGGAVDSNSANSVYRASSELLRHIIVSNRLKEKAVAMNFYEQRLLYFRLGKGDLEIKSRLEKPKKDFLTLPDLEYDEQVPHIASKFYIVHRCLYLNQPEFIGGKIERLCI